MGGVEVERQFGMVYSGCSLYMGARSRWCSQGAGQSIQLDCVYNCMAELLQKIGSKHLKKTHRGGGGGGGVVTFFPHRRTLFSLSIPTIRIVQIQKTSKMQKFEILNTFSVSTRTAGALLSVDPLTLEHLEVAARRLSEAQSAGSLLKTRFGIQQYAAPRAHPFFVTKRRPPPPRQPPHPTRPDPPISLQPCMVLAGSARSRFRICCRNPVGAIRHRAFLRIILHNVGD